MLIDNDLLALNRKNFEENEPKNVFIIMRYGTNPIFIEIEKAIKEIVKEFDLNPILARDVRFYDHLWDNVRFCMRYSRYAIVIFERIVEPDYNPNVALELGYMLALTKGCLILKEKSLPHLPTDVIGRLYEDFDTHNLKHSLDIALNNFFTKYGHLKFKPSKIINEKTKLQSYKFRTREIINFLSDLKDNRLKDNSGKVVLRHLGTLSSLAISENEALHEEMDQEYKDLLIREKNIMLQLLKYKVTIKILICPASHSELIPLRPKDFINRNIIPRYEELIKMIEENIDNSYLQIAYASTLSFDNLLAFEGIVEVKPFMCTAKRRINDKGYSSTLIVYDPNLIMQEIQDFDLTFTDNVAAILNLKSVTLKNFKTKDLKVKVINRLRQSLKEIKNNLV